MITSLLSNALFIHLCAFSGFLILFIMCITSSLAPPCKGPFKLAIAPVIAP
jgi:hypothetical protein